MGYRHSREELLSAAVDVTLDQGIGALTFGSVAKRLGTSDRTIVYYFPSKPDLIMAVAGSLSGQLQGLLEEAFGNKPLSPTGAIKRAWPVLASSEADPIFAIYFEIVGLASAGTEPYKSLAPVLVDGWVDWLDPRLKVSSSTDRRGAALATVAQLDGLLLIRQMSGAAEANAAARYLGIAS